MESNTIQSLAVQALNISLLFSLGLELSLTQLRTTARQVWLMSLMVVLNFGVLPLIAIGASHISHLADAISAGILLSVFAPGGGTGTLLTRLAGGNLALSVIALAVLTLLAVPITPVLTTLFLSASESIIVQPSEVFETLLLFQLTPFLAGVCLRWWSQRVADRLNCLVRPASNVIFAVLVAGLTITQGHLILEVGWQGMGMLTAIIVISFMLPLALRLNESDCAAISLTTAVRNLSLALLISTKFFTHLTTITVLTYGLVMYLIGVPWALWWRRHLPTVGSERSLLHM